MPTIASLSLVPGPDAVTHAPAWLETLAEQQQWPQRTGFKLSLCLDEALTNVVLYGFQDKQNASAENHIELAVSQDGNTLLLDIVDHGLPFDPTTKTISPLSASLQESDIACHGFRLLLHYLHYIPSVPKFFFFVYSFSFF